MSALVLEKYLVFVLLKHDLNSKFSCEKGGEERLIEERKKRVDNHSYTPKFRTFDYWYFGYLFHLKPP